MKVLRRPIIILAVLALAIMACNFMRWIDTDRIQDRLNQEGEPSAEVDAQEDQQQPQADQEEEARARGQILDNPAPVGMEVEADNKAFLVLSAIRPADAVVSEANRFNHPPEEGEEYLLVEFQVTCQKSPSEVCSFHPFNILVYGSLEEKHTVAFVAGLENEHEMLDFNGGETVTGVMPFLVGQGETDLTLVYQPFSGGAYFFEVPE